jgi:UDP-glucose 4-epimerase
MKVKKNTLITGGMGFIGVNLFKKLSVERNVKVFDNLQRASPTGWIGKDSDIFSGDILELSSLDTPFKDISDVVHLAAFGSVVESIKDPMMNFSVNAQGTLNVLKSAVSAGAKRLIFASTGGALIGDALPPVNEIALPKPISPYGASKLCGEAYCHAFAKSYGLETICLRFGNVYGPHSCHKRGAVTLFIKALLKNEPIVIYGSGEASRDYIHVDDLCEGISIALNAPLVGGDVFHLASGRETSVLELAKILCKVSGKPSHPIEFRSARTGEVDRNFADYSKAKSTFNFSPKIDIEDGLAQTWEWFSKQDISLVHAETNDS